MYPALDFIISILGCGVAFDARSERVLGEKQEKEEERTEHVELCDDNRLISYAFL